MESLCGRTATSSRQVQNTIAYADFMKQHLGTTFSLVKWASEAILWTKKTYFETPWKLVDVNIKKVAKGLGVKADMRASVDMAYYIGSDKFCLLLHVLNQNMYLFFQFIPYYL